MYFRVTTAVMFRCDVSIEPINGKKIDTLHYCIVQLYYTTVLYNCITLLYCTTEIATDH